MDLLKNSKKLGMAIIVSGPSGAGKSSICALARREMKDIRFSISCTTRPPRPGEEHGKDYYFISREEFRNLVENGGFVEHAEVFSNYYGTLKSEVMDHIVRGDDVILDIDIQGAMQIHKAAAADPLLARCVEFIFIAPPSLQELERRLRNRQSDSEEQIRQRLAKAVYEISFWKKYDYLLFSDQLEESVREMTALLRALRSATKRMPEDLFDV